MTKSFLLAGLAAFALISTTAAAHQSPEAIAGAALTRAPVFDGHNDMPWALRARVDNDIDSFDFVDTPDTAAPDRDTPRGAMRTDHPRLRIGTCGAHFWSGHCPPNANNNEGG